MKHGLLKKLAAAPFLFICFFAGAQQDSMGISKSLKTALRFHSITNIGLLAGASDRDLQIQTIAGLQYKTWFAGAGAGLDYYYFRGVPLFLDVRKTFSKAHAFFVYTDIGWHLPRIKKEQQTATWYTSDFKKGLYYDVGAGWNFKLNRRNALLFSAGYSVKKLREIQKSNFIPPGADEELYTSRLDYDLRRISIKAGFQF